MIQMIWKRILRRKMTSFTLLFALVSLFVLIPLGLHQSEEATAKVDEAITKHGRGNYDILVRPSSSRSEIEQTLGVVEDNYIGDGDGGISIDEWEEMKEKPELEIAAPVASLGYFRGMQLSVELPVPDEQTRFTYQFYTSDGEKKYPTSDSITYFYFGKMPDGNLQYLADPDKTGDQMMTGAHMNILMPPSHYLLAAIDLESEEQLTGMDLSSLNRDPEKGTLKDALDNYGNPPLVKVLQREDLNIPVYMEVKTGTIDVNAGDYLERLGLDEHTWLHKAKSTGEEEKKELQVIFDELEHKKTEDSEKTWIDLTSFQHPYNGTAMTLDEQLNPSVSEQFTGDIDSSIYYTASKIKYENLDGTPNIPLVKHDEPPIYKEIEEKGVSMTETFDIPFMLHQVGTFAPSAISESELTSSPLGIYGGMEATTEEGDTLTPTTEAGSFIPQPASGLTTIDSAETIKGDKPIDAIRIKVAGINEYDESARQKIEDVSTDLLKEGYEVDVVAGSSFQEMTLDVEGIGKVKESWTTLGVAQELKNTWNGITLLTTVLFAIFGVSWLAVRLLFEKNTLVSENEILYKLGWRQSRINWRNNLEQYLLITLAFIFASITLYALEASDVMYGIAFGLWLFAIVAVTFLFKKVQRTSIRSQPYKRLPKIRHYRRLIVPAMFILMLATILISVQLATLVGSYQDSSFTSMGDYTNNLTFWLQLSVLVITFALAIISIAECLNTLMKERKSEFHMYHVIGWRRSRILMHLLRETIIWTGMSIGIGAISGAVILSFLEISSVQQLFGVGISVSLCMLAIFPIVMNKGLSKVSE